MKCLQSEQIYLYLEKELPGPETALIREHLKECPLCRKAVKERRVFIKAAESLPSLKVPQDFSRQVMEQIFPLKIPVRASILAVTACFSVMLTALFILFLRSGQTLVNILINLNHSVWNFLKHTLVLSAKISKLAILLIKTISQCIQQIFNGLASLTSILGPELQIALIILSLAIFTIIFYGLKKKLSIGEHYE
jgi:hypothetical protein